MNSSFLYLLEGFIPTNALVKNTMVTQLSYK